MNRSTLLALGLLAGVLAAVPADADEPPEKLTASERGALYVKWRKLDAAGSQAYRAGKYADAAGSRAEALTIARRLYPAVDFPSGHENLSSSLSNLGVLYGAQGKFAAAEPLLTDALAMDRALHKGSHSDVATSLINLGSLYHAQGKLAAAEPLLTDALAMHRSLHRGDHPAVAACLGRLGNLYEAQNKLSAAEGLYEEALAMNRALHKGDHPAVAASLVNLSTLRGVQGKFAAAEQLGEEALAMYRALGDDHPVVARCLSQLAGLYMAQGKFAAAEPLLTDALAMRQTLHKGAHPDVATSLINLGNLYRAQGKFAAAEPLLTDALAIYRALYKGAHPAVATCLSVLSILYIAQGKVAAAEPLLTDALAMDRALHKGDHPAVATGLRNLGNLYKSQGRLAAAEPLLTDALAMDRALHKGDHPDLALSLGSMGAVYHAQGKSAAAERLLTDALAMLRAVHKGDHPEIAQSLKNLGGLYWDQGKPAATEPLYADALAMYRAVYKGDHPDIARSLSGLGAVYHAQGKSAAAEPLLTDALAMGRRLAMAFARDKTEGETLTLLSRGPLTRDAFLSTELALGSPAPIVYAQLWAEKGAVARVYARRQAQARAAAVDPATAKLLADLADARRRRAELLLAPATRDPVTLAKRDEDSKTYAERIEKGTREVAARLPALARADALTAAVPVELQRVLPADAAVVDFLRFTHFGFDTNKPGKEGETRTPRYLAFVVTKSTVAWADLGTAAAIEPAVRAWREALTSGKEVPASLPAKVRELVWAKVRKQLPAGIKTLYLCPDAALCGVPFAALPGDAPGTVLLEDFALATIPHAPFLLDKLLPQDPLKNPPAGALVVGGVRYDAESAPPPVGAVATRGDPLVKPDQKLVWSALANTAGEADGVAAAAVHKKLTVAPLRDSKATPAAVLAALPRARYAHLATHGFFADASFRSAFQLDPKDFEMRGGERVGKAALSPLVMTGLVFAGANNPKAPGRGIVTGEQLIDLDLSGLELAVLSACETGLGDVAGGEGVFGLQRAFHYAGATNVVCSLWKVPDQSTAALMALFYRNLWDKNLTPMESLRQAQLEMYRNPQKVPELAKGFRGVFPEVDGPKGDGPAALPGKDGKAHPLQWAAFTLSGPGR